MHRSRAPSIAPGTFFVAQPWADCITNMPGFNLRQAQVLEEVGCCGGLHRLHRCVEIRDRPPLALMELCLDLVDEDAPRPAVFDGCPPVPKPLLVVLELIQESDILAPGQLCNDLLHNFLIGPG
jgi:hypothetical protein